jgi:hypothetical protein
MKETYLENIVHFRLYFRFHSTDFLENSNIAISPHELHMMEV